MMAKVVDEPRGRNVNAQLAAVITLAVLHLTHERLAAGQVDVGHHVQRAHELQAAFGQEAAEIGFLLRVAVEKRFHIRHLVEREPVRRLLAKQSHGFQDVRQARLQVTFPRLEDGALPVGVRNDPERGLGRRLVGHDRRARRRSMPRAMIEP